MRAHYLNARRAGVGFRLRQVGPRGDHGAMNRLACVVLVGVVACAKKSEQSPLESKPMASAVAANETVTQDDAGAHVTHRERVMSSTSLQDALTTAREESQSDGERKRVLSDWAAGHLKWAEVDVKKSETSTLLALKDPLGAYGKRACMAGTVVTITAVRDADAGPGAPKGFAAVLQGATELWTVFAVGDTGDLVKGSRTGFCGVALGPEMAKKSDGVPSDALALVGFFDLPANRGGAGQNPVSGAPAPAPTAPSSNALRKKGDLVPY